MHYRIFLVDQLFSIFFQLTLEIAAVLPEKFGIIFDGWDNGHHEHFVAIFAVFPDSTTTGRSMNILLAMQPLLTPDCQNAVAHADFIVSTLGCYNKSPQNLLFLVGDNTNTNPAIARILSVTLIGCGSHRLNLGVKRLLLLRETLIEKVHDLMVRLSSIKNVARLSKLTHLWPEINNQTRWLSTFNMIEKYLKMREVIEKMEDPDNQIEFALPTREQQLQIKLLASELNTIRLVTTLMQDANVDLSKCRFFFDELRESFAALDDDLRPNSSHVMNPNFESAIVKIIRGEFGSLSQAESYEARIFKKPRTVLIEDAAAGTASMQPPPTLEERIHNIAAKQPRLNQSGADGEYIDLTWIPSTSYIVERLFSKAKYILTDHRASMHPKTLESILMLKENRSLWSAVLMDRGMRKTADVVGAVDEEA